MGTPLRYIPPGGAVVEITNRTVQGRYLLRPSAEFNDLLIGVLGRAQRLTGVDVHFFVVLSNHLHLIVSVESSQQLADFSSYFFGNLAREVCRQHDWSDKVWARRYRMVSVTEEDLAELERLRYSISNSCKEGLVGSPLEWPGAHAAAALAEGKTRIPGTWINRTAQYRARKGRDVDSEAFREREYVELTPIPSWAGLSQEKYSEWVQAMILEVEEETRRHHREHGTRPMGVAKILRQDPHARPRSMKRSPAPLVHAATKAARWAYWEAYHLFVASYRDACERLRRTGLPVEFPEGSFLPPGLAAVQQTVVR